jgi:hypothetical protein
MDEMAKAILAQALQDKGIINDNTRAGNQSGRDPKFAAMFRESLEFLANESFIELAGTSTAVYRLTGKGWTEAENLDV